MIRSGAGPQSTNSNELVLIEVRSILNHKRSIESTWAKRLGEDIYQIKGPLHFIGGLNFDGILRAEPVSESPHPSVLEVVSRSGYRTIHLAFDRSSSPSERTRILERLTDLNVGFDMLVEFFYTLQIEPVLEESS